MEESSGPRGSWQWGWFLVGKDGCRVEWLWTEDRGKELEDQRRLDHSYHLRSLGTSPTGEPLKKQGSVNDGIVEQMEEGSQPSTPVNSIYVGYLCTMRKTEKLSQNATVAIFCRQDLQIDVKIGRTLKKKSNTYLPSKHLLYIFISYSDAFNTYPNIF